MALSQEETVRLIFEARSRLSASIWLVVRDTQAAEDIFQNTAIKALTKGATFESAGQLLSWVQVTARHEAIDWLRHRRPEWVAPDEAILALLEEQVCAAAPTGARVDALRECLESVPVSSREMLQARYYEGCSCAEVAERVGLGLDAVYQRLSRLHRALRDCVDKRLALESGPATAARKAGA